MWQWPFRQLVLVMVSDPLVLSEVFIFALDLVQRFVKLKFDSLSKYVNGSHRLVYGKVVKGALAQEHNHENNADGP